jgi:hypothetical protein
VTLSFRIGKVHHIILRCEALAEPRRTGRGSLRMRAEPRRIEGLVNTHFAKVPLSGDAFRARDFAQSKTLALGGKLA